MIDPAQGTQWAIPGLLGGTIRPPHGRADVFTMTLVSGRASSESGGGAHNDFLQLSPAAFSQTWSARELFDCLVWIKTSFYSLLGVANALLTYQSRRPGRCRAARAGAIAQAQYSIYDITSTQVTGASSELTVVELGGTIVGTNVVGNASFTTGPTATISSLSFAGTIDGYAISVSGSFNAGSTSVPGLLAYTTSLTPGVGVGGDFFTINSQAGDYTTPLGSNLVYTNTQTSSGLNATNLADFLGYLIADNGLSVYYSNLVGSLQPSNTTSQSVAAGSLYDLYQYGQILTDGTGPVSQTMSSLVAAPEPNSVLLGLLGLPCMGLVVYCASRRSSRLTAEVA